MSLHFKIQGSELHIVGHTFPHREAIKALGATFDQQKKIWRLRHSSGAEIAVAKLCEEQGGGMIESAPQNANADTSAIKLDADAETLTKNRIPNYETDPFVNNGPRPTLTIAQLMSRTLRALQAEFTRAEWISGEIQNFNLRGLGAYFQLSEPKEGSHGALSVSAVLWKRQWNILTERYQIQSWLQDGIKVRLLCEVQWYADRGMLSLNVLDFDPDFTKGNLALAREMLMKELRSKGLDRANKSVPIPRFLSKIGLITADGSRAKSDFLDQLVSHGFPGTVLFCAAQMQGEKTTKELVQALKLLSAAGCDLIVVTRGGGSSADLRWFDEKELAYAIALADKPVVAAIGHHDDTCIAEMVAHHREKTPTAAADFVLAHVEETRQALRAAARSLGQKALGGIDKQRERVHQLIGSMQWSVSKCFGRFEQKLSAVSQEIYFCSIARVDSRAEQLNRRAESIFDAALRRLDEETKQLVAAENKVGQRDPRPWIAKGWTQLALRGKPLLSVQDLEKGEEVLARLIDGQVKLQVLSKATHP